MFFYLREKKLVEYLVSIYNETLDRIWLESEMENADDLELPPWWHGQQPDLAGWTREQQACFRNLWSW